jgi:hypothetical protein
VTGGENRLAEARASRDISKRGGVRGNGFACIRVGIFECREDLHLKTAHERNTCRGWQFVLGVQLSLDCQVSLN